MILERSSHFLWIFPVTKQLARIYQTWKSKDQFILDFPNYIDDELKKRIEEAFQQVSKQNPEQLFKILE